MSRFIRKHLLVMDTTHVPIFKFFVKLRKESLKIWLNRLLLIFT